MFYSNSVMVLLCWIAVLGLREVEAQDDGDGTGGAPGDPNANFFGGSRSGDGDDNGKSFGHRNRAGFRTGGRFEKGARKGQQQGNDQAATDDQNGENDEEDEDALTSPSPTIDPAPVETSAASASITANSPTTLLETPKSFIFSSAPTESFEQPTSVANAFPEPQPTSPNLAGIPYVAPSSSASIQNLSSLFAPASASAPSLAFPLTTSRLTVTISTTIYVTESSLPPQTSISIEEDTSALTQATQAPSMDLAPPPASSVKPLSAGKKAGVGIGVTLAVLIIVGAIAYELYRRRRKAKARERLGSDTGSQDLPRRSLAFTGFFGPNDDREPRSDPEWSIESASKVSMVRAGSVKSVDSHMRPTSPLPSLQPPYLPSGPKPILRTGDEMEIVRVGMTVPDRKPTMRLAGMALRSNPPVSPSAFPSPPRKEKTGSWPLAD